MNMVRIIDVETTGLDAEVDRVVEIAKMDWMDGDIGGGISDLIDPGIPIPALAKAVHHITEADTAGKPILDEVMPAYSGVDIVAAHNADFDRRFLPPDFAKYWVCTYKVALRIWPELPSHSNQFLRYHLGLPDPTGGAPHRALYDAFVTAYLFAEELQHMTVKEMVAISREPALMAIITFGKHRGSKFADVPRDYLDWLIRNHDDENVKFSARKALEAM